MVIMSEPLSIEDARARLPELAAAVRQRHERVTLQLADGGEVVLMNADDLASLEATLETLSDPELMAGLKRSLEQEARGEFVEVDDLR
jgi:Phd_YefM.